MQSSLMTKTSPLSRVLSQEAFVYIHDGWRMLAPRGWAFVNGHHQGTGDGAHEFHWHHPSGAVTVGLSLWVNAEGEEVHGFLRVGGSPRISFQEAGLLPCDTKDPSIRDAAQIHRMIAQLQREAWAGHADLRPLLERPEAVAAVCTELAFLASQCGESPVVRITGENIMHLTEHQSLTKAQRKALNEQRAIVQMIPVKPTLPEQNSLQMFVDGVLVASSPSYTQLGEYLIGVMQEPDDDEEDEA